MKVNLKKIGAIVAGATILASSAAFAGLMFGSTTLVDDNGAPVAKVVVGGSAQPIDAVAAGLVASKLASEAYKSVELTAEFAGTATCTAAENGEAVGTCAISNEKAQLEITVPGVQAAGTWTGENLIGDYLNRELGDREDNDPGDTDAAYPMGGSDTSDNANPFTDGVGTGTIGPNEVFLYRIDGDQLSTFADVAVLDADAGNSYVEMQNLWISGDNHYDEDPEEVIGLLDFVAYTVKFDGPGSDEMGIPACTDAEDADYGFCKWNSEGDIDDATETHRVKVWFLGEEWIISEMNPPTNSDPDPTFAGDGVYSESAVFAGGDIKLAKEAVSGILNQGESLPVDDLKFQLDDLEAHGDTTSAILSVLDANGNILEKDKVDPGETREFNVAGSTYRFHVYKVAPGYTFGAKWADVAIFSHELHLEDGKELDSENDTNPAYEVTLGWKNLDASTGVAVVDGGNPEYADTLRTIAIWSDDIDELSSSGEKELLAGDYISFVQDPEKWKLSYLGVDLTSDDMEMLTFDLELDSTESFKMYNNDKSVYSTCELYPPFVEVTTSDSGSVFRTSGYVEFDGVAGGLGDVIGSGNTELSSDEFFVAMTHAANPPLAWVGGPGDDWRSGLWCDWENDGMGDILDTGTDTALGDGIVMALSDQYDGFAPMWIGTTYAEGGQPLTAVEIQYDDIGDGDHELEGGGLIIVEPGITYAWGGPPGNPSKPSLCDDWNQAPNDDSGGVPGADLELESLVYGEGNNFACAPATVPTPSVWSSYIFAVAEKAGEGSSDEFTGYFIFGVDHQHDGSGNFDDATFAYDYVAENALGGDPSDDYPIMTSDDDEIFYLWAGPVEPLYSFSIEDEDFISERGSEFVAKDDDQVKFDMAHKLGWAEWLFAPSEAAVEDLSKTIVTLGEGESETVQGVTVKVLEITEDVGACGANGGAVACVADMSGVSAVIMPDNVPSVQAAMPYTGDYGSLVILDQDAVGVNTLVSIGGDKVNSVTADLLQGSAVDWTAERKVVREVVQGSKIVVAGREGEDTLEAAQDFVAQLQKV